MTGPRQLYCDPLEYLDGKSYVLDGVSGTFKKEFDPRGFVRLIHEANAEGKKSVEYRNVRRFLGDDYDTDITDSMERYTAIAAEIARVERATERGE